MKRVFLTAVLAMVFVIAHLLPAWCQRADKPRRVGVLAAALSSDPWARPLLQVLVDGLREHGWEEGRNVVLEVRYAGLDPARFLDLAAELDALKVDVIVTSNTEVLRWPGARSGIFVGRSPRGGSQVAARTEKVPCHCTNLCVNGA